MTPIETYFDVVHRHTPETALIGISTITGHSTPITRWYQKRYIEKMIADIRSIGARANVYARITPLGAPPSAGRGTEAAAMGSSVLYVDYDSYSDVVSGLKRARDMQLPPTMIVSSGNGLHLYFSLDRLYTDIDAVKARNKQLALDLGGKSEGGDSCFDLARVLRVVETYNVKGEKPIECTLIEYHAERVYTLEQFAAAPLDEMTINHWDHEPLPVDFIERLRILDHKLVKRILTEETALKADAPRNGVGVDRSRNDAFIAVRLLSLGYTPGIAMSVLMHDQWFSGDKYREKYRFDYVAMTVNSAARDFTRSPDRYFQKSTFVADRLSTELRSERPYIFTAAQLWRYDNGVYRNDAEDHIKAATVTRLGTRWSTHARDQTIAYITDQSRIDIDTINRHEPLINCANGMFDVRDGKLYAHDPQYLSTVQIPADYNPNADTTALDRFLAQIMPSDAIPFFWEYIGSSFLMSRYWPKAFLALVGPRNSGKSKVLEWLFKFFGGKRNVTTLSLQTLADSKFAALDLFGQIANIFPDLDEAEAQSTGMIKVLTGDDNIAAEKKFGGFITFKNTARLIFSANHYPPVKSPDEAYFFRARIIPCVNVFDGANADQYIVDKLITPDHLSAGLLRASQGLKRLLDNRDFSPSVSIDNANAEYRYSADTVSGFLNASDIDPDYFIPKQEMYQIYKVSCISAGRKQVSEDRFFKRVADNLARFGITEEYRTVNGSRVWVYAGRKPRSIADTPAMFPLVLGKN